MIPCHLVAMEINKGLLILFIIIQLFFHESQPCDNMDDRNPKSYSPISEVTFIPADDTFPVGTLLSIVCKGKKSLIGDDQYSFPTQIVIFINETTNRDHCHIAKGDTSPEKTCVLKVNMTKPDTLSITCQVDNSYDCSYHKKTIYIKEKEKPHLWQQPPRHINATEGQHLNITCASRAVPRPVITWYKDDVMISTHQATSFRGDSVLMLQDIDKSSQGKYTCRANNSLGVVSSNGSFLTVFFRPLISLSPVNHTVAIGTRVLMACNATGLPIPLIGWLKDGVVLGTGSGSDHRHLVGKTMSVVDVVSQLHKNASVGLSITPSADYLINTTGNDVIRSPSPSLSPTSTFTRPTPQVTNSITRSPTTSTVTSPIPRSTTSSIPLSTTCSIPLSTSAARSIPPTQRPFHVKMTQNGRHSTLVIESVTQEDEGKYLCYAENAIGNATSSHAILLVYIPEKLEKPRFLSSPINVSVPAGLNTTMTCTAVGHPHPNITWYKNNMSITEEGRVSVVTNGNTSVVMVTYVRHEDEGVYMCKAENSVGSGYSKQAFLRVQDVFQPSASRSSGDLNPLIPALGTLLPVLLVVMVILLILIRRKQKTLQHPPDTGLVLSNSMISQAQKDKVVEGIRNEAVNDEEFQDEAVYLLLMGIDRDWEISRDRLRLTNQRLGVGCFGQVDKGIYTRRDSKEMFVAVKKLKDPRVQTHREDIIAELDMLKRVGRHPNVVSLVGACTREDPLCIIIEFVEGGSLNDLLIKAHLPETREKMYENIISRLTERDLVKIAADIARGMKHLHDKNCIHRDLAARNILIGSGLVAKIADFGLARHVIDGFYVKQSPGKVPWKWMAPEALQGLFTTKTDVWSFGILLWEIATLGGTPYPAITQLVVLYNMLSNGYRMSKPKHCHEMLYSVMTDCWAADTNKRPAFGEIYKMLEDMLNQNERIYINLEEMDEEELEHQF